MLKTLVVSGIVGIGMLAIVPGCTRESGDQSACARFEEFAAAGESNSESDLTSMLDFVTRTATKESIIEAATDLKVYMEIGVSIPGRATHYAQALAAACEGS